MTKVFLKPPTVASFSLQRVATQLEKYKPDDVEIVTNPKKADLVILHVIGRQDRMLDQASKCADYAVIQYAVRSTLRPETGGWMPLWNAARLVWSYYDLELLCNEDGVNHSHVNFYHSPLGVDAVFSQNTEEKKYLVMTTGQSYLTEGVRECIVAAQGQPVAHLGHQLRKKYVTCKTGLTDEELAQYYSECLYVSGLRRVEGFELPAAEGLLCGARPILFDRPHYRQWFEDFGIFIPEAPREEVVSSLKYIFDHKVGLPVTKQEQDKARELFNWETIIKGFWERVL